MRAEIFSLGEGEGVADKEGFVGFFREVDFADSVVNPLDGLSECDGFLVAEVFFYCGGV